VDRFLNWLEDKMHVLGIGVLLLFFAVATFLPVFV